MASEVGVLVMVVYFDTDAREVFISFDPNFWPRYSSPLRAPAMLP
jgi:hypothetical protein